MIAVALMVLLQGDAVSDLVEKIRAAEEKDQARVAAQLPALVKAEHLPQLVKETEDGPEALRPFFIRAIGRIGGAEASAALVELTQRFGLSTRAEAAGQLKILGDPAGPKALVQLLPHASTDPEKVAVVRQLFAGSPVDTPDVVPAIARFLEKETLDDLRRLAVQALGSHGYDGVTAVLRPVALAPADPARFLAIAELLKRGDDTVLEAGLRGMEDPKTDRASLFVLVSAFEQANRPASLPRMRALLERAGDRDLKISLLRALATMKDEQAVGVITKLSQDPDPAVAKVAQESIVRLGARAQVETIKKAAAPASTDTDLLQRLEAAETLILADSPEGWAAVRAAVKDGSTTVKYRALRILAQQNRKEAVDLLVLLLDDPAEYVRSSARSSLVATLTALHPYQRFDYQAPADKLKLWWEKNRGK